MLMVDAKDMVQAILVSRLHHAIARGLTFQARYFLRSNRRCEAIYAASQHRKLFTPELLNVSRTLRL